MADVGINVKEVDDKVEVIGNKVEDIGNTVEDIDDKVQSVDEKVQVVFDGERGLSGRLLTLLTSILYFQTASKQE
jgi:hypothetical protein